jgi:hypothetical protein
VLHLRPGAREWFLRWLGDQHPGLVRRYRELYGGGAYAAKDYQQRISEQVRELAARHGVGRASPARARRTPENRPAAGSNQAGPVQLALL